MAGSVCESVLQSEYEQASIFCLASLAEGLGVAYMEAMSMEVPVIGARSPGVESLIDHGRTGYVVERTADAFIETIKHLIDHPDQTCATAQAGRQAICRAFHSGISAEKILANTTHLSFTQNSVGRFTPRIIHPR